MVDLPNKPRKGTISEEDISTLLQRYSATTVLSLLQEVAQVQSVNIDWNELVKKTTTGITNAREYQMLWRHLAYRDSLVELEDGAVPMDDDSDLEYELESFPPVSAETLAEAAACAKVLIASGSQSDTSLLNGSTVEAPLTINIPNGQSSRAAPDNSQLKGTNITIPVSVQKQPLPTVTSAEGLDASGSGSGNVPPRRKRKPWSEAEDLELIAAVEKCGEGNWANILKGDFKGDRTASQLSQRWAIIKKRQGNSTAGSGSQISEVQLAVRNAVSMALDLPKADKLKPTCSNGTAGTNMNPPPVEASPIGTQSQQQTRQDSASTTSSKSRITFGKILTKTALSPDALVKAAAVAAGARIATPSDAASLLKAAQAKHAIHIMPGGGSLAKSSVAVNANALPPNVHYIRTGLATTHSSYPPVSTNASRSGGSQQAQNNSLKPTAQIVQLNTAQAALESNSPAEVSNVATSSPASDLNANDNIDSSPCNPLKELVQQDKVPVSVSGPIEKVQESQAVVPGDASEEKVLEDQAPVSSSEKREQSLDQEIMDVPIEGGEHQSEAEKPSEKGGGENQSAAEKTSDNRSSDEKQGVLTVNSRDASDENSEVAN